VAQTHPSALLKMSLEATFTTPPMAAQRGGPVGFVAQGHALVVAHRVEPVRATLDGLPATGIAVGTVNKYRATAHSVSLCDVLGILCKWSCAKACCILRLQCPDGRNQLFLSGRCRGCFIRAGSNWRTDFGEAMRVLNVEEMLEVSGGCGRKRSSGKSSGKCGSKRSSHGCKSVRESCTPVTEPEVEVVPDEETMED
jgi:hypothetical protein